MKNFYRIRNTLMGLFLAAPICHVLFHMQWSWWWMIPLWLVIPGFYWSVVGFMKLRLYRKMSELQALRVHAADSQIALDMIDEMLHQHLKKEAIDNAPSAGRS